MAFVVETGAGLSNANSYASLDTAIAYALDRGLTFATSPSSLGEQALVRATQAVDSLYRLRFSGTKHNGRSQALEWPRDNATDIDGETIANNEIPIEVIHATCELAVREFTNPNSILPDLERGGAIRAIRAGSVSIEYGSNASNTTVWQTVNGIMASLIGGGVGSSNFAFVTRG